MFGPAVEAEALTVMVIGIELIDTPLVSVATAVIEKVPVVALVPV